MDIYMRGATESKFPGTCSCIKSTTPGISAACALMNFHHASNFFMADTQRPWHI